MRITSFLLITEARGGGNRAGAGQEDVQRHTLLHVHNTCFRWPFGNVRCHADGNGNIKPLKNKSTGRIDPAVASIIAMAVWMVARNQKPDLAAAVARADFTL